MSSLEPESWFDMDFAEKTGFQMKMAFLTIV